jgi:EmrB/QacA subfamily drug resistance transporter
MFGRRRLFLVGLAGFAVASAAGGAAGDLSVLLAARAVQGAFAAMLAPALLALLTTTFTDSHERSRAFGIFGAVAGTGAALGLMLGGLLTQYLSWRSCLYVNVILAGLTLIGAWVLLAHDRPEDSAPIDVPGAVAVSSGLFFVVFGFARAESDGWTDPLTVVYLLAGAGLIAIFAGLQSRVAHPLLPLRILDDRNRVGAYLATFVMGVGMFGVFLFLTYYMQGTLGFSALRSGVAFLPMSAVIVAASTTASTQLSPRVSPKIMIPVGMTIAALGMVVFTRVTVHGSYLQHVLPASLVFGIGLGTVFGFASNTATRDAAPDDSGVVSAMVNVSQQVGAAIGTALLNTVASSTAKVYLGTHTGAEVAGRAVVHGYAVGFAVAAAIFLVGAVVTAVVLRPGVLGMGESTSGGSTSGEGLAL